MQLLTCCNNAGPAFAVGVAGVAVLRLSCARSGAYLYAHPRDGAAALAAGLLLRAARGSPSAAAPPPAAGADGSLAQQFADRRRDGRGGGHDGAGVRVRGVLPDVLLRLAETGLTGWWSAPGSARLLGADQRHPAAAARPRGASCGRRRCSAGEGSPSTARRQPSCVARGSPSARTCAARPCRPPSPPPQPPSPPMDIIKSSPLRTNKRIARHGRAILFQVSPSLRTAVREKDPIRFSAAGVRRKKHSARSERRRLAKGQPRRRAERRPLAKKDKVLFHEVISGPCRRGCPPPWGHGTSWT